MKTDKLAEIEALPVRYVKQEDAHGCGVAVLAMLTGQTYQQVKADLLGMGCVRPDGFAERGIDFEVVNEYLRRKGYATTKQWANCPITKQPNNLRPFEAIQYANVEQHSGNWHFVVLLADGTVLDPLDPAQRTLDSYARIGSVTAIHKLADYKEMRETLAGLVEAFKEWRKRMATPHAPYVDAMVSLDAALAKAEAALGGEK